MPTKKKTPVKKKVVKAKVAAKIVTKKQPKPKDKEVRFQTAEGWKRMMLRQKEEEAAKRAKPKKGKKK